MSAGRRTRARLALGRDRRRAALVGACLTVALVVTACSSPKSSTEISAEEIGVPDTWDQMFGGTPLKEVVAQQREEYRTDRPHIPGGIVPEVPLERVVSTQEWPGLMVECLAGKGFVATATADGGVRLGDVPEDQGEALNRASAECRLRYWPDPRQSTSTVPREPAKALYAYLVDVASPCVESEGYTVSEPPSKEVWVEAKARGENAWSPYDRVIASDPDPEEWDALVNACPQVPTGFYPSWPD